MDGAPTRGAKRRGPGTDQAPAREQGSPCDSLTIMSEARPGGKPGSDGRPPCLSAALDYLGRGWPALVLCPPDHVGVSLVNRSHIKKCGNPGKVPWHPWKDFQARLPTPAEISD